jgi:predicted RNA-binding protein YlxR (DUF448 family)
MMAPNTVRESHGISAPVRESHGISAPARETPPPRDDAGGKRRRCILSRRECAIHGLVRFVVGPTNRIIPDLAERLPGRGLWLSASRSAVEQARTNGNFARAARAAVIVDTGLAEQVGDLLAARSLNFLGLALRSGGIAIGHEQVRADLKAGRAAILVQASDGAPPARQRMRALANGLPAVELFTRAELSQALGRADTVHAVLHASRLSSMFLRECGRLAGFRASETANETADRVGNE